MLREISPRRGVDFLADLAGAQLRLGEAEGVLQVLQALFLALAQTAVDGQGIAHHAGVAFDFGRDADHHQLARLQKLGARRGDDGA